MIRLDLPALADRLLAAQGAPRRLVAIAGAPGSGKSAAAERLRDLIEARRPGLAEVLPMDGFHFDDGVLEARGDRPRKGAPHTFDVGGLGSALARLRADGGEVAVPVFDREIEIARAGARIIGPGARLILVEGNYLLLDEAPWRALRPSFDATVFLDVPEEVLEARLRARWLGLGLTAEALRAKLEENDLPNARLVVDRSLPADFTVPNA